MTTVAYDGSEIYADACSELHGALLPRQNKIDGNEFGYKCAAAGNPGSMNRLIDSFEAGQALDNPLDCVVLISYTQRHTQSFRSKTFVIDGYGVGTDITGYPFAIGSGAHFAIGAMAMGATAKQAVEIAAKYDKGTRV